jgi:hypothetical protein
VYEKAVHRPFKSVSEYFKLLEARTGVKFDHSKYSPSPSHDSSMLIRNKHSSKRNLLKDNVLLFKGKVTTYYPYKIPYLYANILHVISNYITL